MGELLQYLPRKRLLQWRLWTGRRERLMLRPGLRLMLMLRLMLTLTYSTLPTDTGLWDTPIWPTPTLPTHTVTTTDTTDSDIISDTTARGRPSQRLLLRLILRLFLGCYMEVTMEDTCTEDTTDTDTIMLYLITTWEDAGTTWVVWYLVPKHQWRLGGDIFSNGIFHFAAKSYSQYTLDDVLVYVYWIDGELGLIVNRS